MIETDAPARSPGGQAVVPRPYSSLFFTESPALLSL